MAAVGSLGPTSGRKTNKAFVRRGLAPAALWLIRQDFRPEKRENRSVALAIGFLVSGYRGNHGSHTVGGALRSLGSVVLLSEQASFSC